MRDPRGRNRRRFATTLLCAVLGVGGAATAMHCNRTRPADERADALGRPQGDDAAAEGRDVAAREGSAATLAARPSAATGTASRRTVRGVVLDAATGLGVADATVVAEALRSPESRVRTTSRADGAFVIEGLSDGLHLVEVWHPGYASPGAAYRAWQRHVDSLGEGVAGPRPDGTLLRVPHEPDAGPVLLRLGQGPEVRGVVLDDEGRPFAGARVRVKMDPGRSTEDWDFPAAADGTFVLRMAEFDYVGAVAPGHRSTWVRVPLREGPMRIVLRREATLHGEVRWSDGRPAGGALIVARTEARWVAGPFNDVARTDDAGCFALQLGPVEHEIFASRERLGSHFSTATRAWTTVRLGPGEERRGLVLTLPTYWELHLELVNASGQPLPHEPVTVLSTWPDGALDPDGRADSAERQRDHRSDGTRPIPTAPTRGAHADPRAGRRAARRALVGRGCTGRSAPLPLDRLPSDPVRRPGLDRRRRPGALVPRDGELPPPTLTGLSDGNCHRP